MITKVVSKDMGVRENGAKARAIQEYSPSWSRVKLQNQRLWVGGSCWGKGIKFELTNKTWACKKTPFVNFPCCLL